MIAVPDNKIWMFDTTLRDGEQALRASLTKKQKLQLAQAISYLGVDIMELGFPASSPGDFDAVAEIARTVKGPIMCALARAVPADVRACGEALSGAEKSRIHTFIASSPLHLQYKLRKTLEQATEQAVNCIELARQYTDDVEFSCEDAGRTPIEDLCYMVEHAIAAGATTINIPDTVGYTVPDEFAAIISALKQRVPNIEQARLSVHCHNDLGLAVANSMAAVAAGARQVEATVNGIGERAGNCSLEEIAMIIKTREEHLGWHTAIQHKEIFRTSRLVSQVCNMPVQQNKAIVGANAFAHSSGIHQDGVLKAQNTYEIMTPESIGVRANELNLTSRSGKHVIKHRLAEMGYREGDYDLQEVYTDFLALADQKGQVFDYDLEALVFAQSLQERDDPYELIALSTTTDAHGLASATVALQCDGATYERTATGYGPVEAAFAAIASMTNTPINMVSYNLGAKGSGANALGQVDITAAYDKQQFHGVGLATDIVRASVMAYIHVLNMIARAQHVHSLKQHLHADNRTTSEVNV
ncbi:2-isopropylmalate synthase [Pseudidiomarina sediminum]|uniref:2-isopropylmalate synthase n=1 Tax=Pseudidiomarina sediminum TaxID=431675 RepID=UPI001C95B8FA|nr:2-isopropylmalate synthase [Pseudidiomarina sediminum]MBY6064129.1 2-isopropylmalate synthase [Pseudidiomarina sediminum]